MTETEPEASDLPLSGCQCVVCITGRANARQAEMIKKLEADLRRAESAIQRVRARCGKGWLRRTSNILTALEGGDAEA